MMDLCVQVGFDYNAVVEWNSFGCWSKVLIKLQFLSEKGLIYKWNNCLFVFVFSEYCILIHPLWCVGSYLFVSFNKVFIPSGTASWTNMLPLLNVALAFPVFSHGRDLLQLPRVKSSRDMQSGEARYSLQIKRIKKKLYIWKKSNVIFWQVDSMMPFFLCGSSTCLW